MNVSYRGAYAVIKQIGSCLIGQTVSPFIIMNDDPCFLVGDEYEVIFINHRALPISRGIVNLMLRQVDGKSVSFIQNT